MHDPDNHCESIDERECHERYDQDGDRDRADSLRAAPINGGAGGGQNPYGHAGENQPESRSGGLGESGGQEPSQLRSQQPEEKHRRTVIATGEQARALALAGEEGSKQDAAAQQSASDNAGAPHDRDLVEVGGRQSMKRVVGEEQHEHRDRKNDCGGDRALNQMAEKSVVRDHRPYLPRLPLSRLRLSRLPLPHSRVGHWLGTAAIACSILSISYSVLLSATNSGCGSNQPVFDLILVDGSTVRVSAPAARVAEFAHERRVALDAALIRIDELGRRTFAAGVSAPFANAYVRLPGFSEWAYSWIGNYIFSYQILFEASRAGGARLFSGDGFVSEVKQAVSSAVAREFDARVLLPARIERHVETALADARALIYDELERHFQRERAAWEAFAGDSCRPAAGGGATQRLVVAGAFIPPDIEPPTVEAGVNGEVSKVFAIRALRPFGVRVAIPTLAAFGIGGMSGFGAGLVVSAGVVWSLDYVVNSFDETMNRSNFELLLVAQVRAEEQRLAAVAGGILRGGLDAGTASYRGGLDLLATNQGMTGRRPNESPRESPIVLPKSP